MTTDSSGATSRILALSGASLLIAASAALGAYYGFTVGAHVHMALGVIFAAAALGGEVLKPLAVLATFDAARSRRWLTVAASAPLALVCIGYSFTAELSLSAGARGDLAANRTAAIDTVAMARDRRAQRTAELEALRPARSPGMLTPMIEKLRATPGAKRCEGEPDGPISRHICGQVADLEAESERFRLRERLTSEIAATDAIIASPSDKLGAADPLASALSAYASALGLRAAPESLSPWLALIPVLFLEIGSALALVVARVIGSPSAPELPPTAPAAVSNNGPDAPPDSGGLGAKVLDLVARSGGTLEGGQRTIARTLGVSKSRLNELLHELASAGRLHLATGNSGTTIRLATA